VNVAELAELTRMAMAFATMWIHAWERSTVAAFAMAPVRSTVVVVSNNRWELAIARATCWMLSESAVVGALRIWMETESATMSTIA
jgi:hypothetical protein